MGVWGRAVSSPSGSDKRPGAYRSQKVQLCESGAPLQSTIIAVPYIFYYDFSCEKLVKLLFDF